MVRKLAQLLTLAPSVAQLVPARKGLGAAARAAARGSARGAAMAKLSVSAPAFTPKTPSADAPAFVPKQKAEN